MTGNEPDAKAILPKPRSVQKANSYQYQLIMANREIGESCWWCHRCQTKVEVYQTYGSTTVKGPTVFVQTDLPGNVDPIIGGTRTYQKTVAIPRCRNCNSEAEFIDGRWELYRCENCKKDIVPVMQEKLVNGWSWDKAPGGYCPQCGKHLFGNAGILGGSCFVATATFGSPLAKEVEGLRFVRDYFLVHRSYGRVFLRLYHRIGPAFALIIARSRGLRFISRNLLRPFIWAANSYVTQRCISHRPNRRIPQANSKEGESNG